MKNAYELKTQGFRIKKYKCHLYNYPLFTEVFTTVQDTAYCFF
jgi:hypothetical protein